MGDYIDREVLKEKFWDACKNCLSEDDIADLIDEAPAADVAPVVHGRWLDEDFPEKMATVHGFAICSVCGKLSHKAEHGYNILSIYCPHCGAKMDKEDTK